MKRINHLTGILCGLFLIPCILIGQDADSLGQYLSRMYIEDGDTLRYRIMYPQGFPDGGPYPLVLFLHGAGERGDDNQKQLVHGSKLFRDSLEIYPAVVVFPQCPTTSFWAKVRRDPNSRQVFTYGADSEPNRPLELVMQYFQEIITQDYIDTHRLYLTGLSMGGMGTWELLWRMPNTFAAALPICGGGVTDKASLMTDVPIWAFHGKLDDIVPPRHSIAMVQAVQREGGKAKITIFPDANHNSWDPAFAEPDYLRWMFSKSR